MKKTLVQQFVFIKIHVFPMPIYFAANRSADNSFSADAAEILPWLG